MKDSPKFQRRAPEGGLGNLMEDRERYSATPGRGRYCHFRVGREAWALSRRGAG